MDGCANKRAFWSFKSLLTTINSGKIVVHCKSRWSNAIKPIHILFVKVRVWMAIEWINCSIFQRITNNAILKQSLDWLIHPKHSHTDSMCLGKHLKGNHIHTFTGLATENVPFVYNGKAIFWFFIACCYHLTGGFYLNSSLSLFCALKSHRCRCVLPLSTSKTLY